MTQPSVTDPQLVLSFRADGPHWTDLVHLLAYPYGVSYLHAFRYSESWFEHSILTSMRTVAYRKALAGQTALIAARFQAPAFSDVVLPLRYATLVRVDETAGTFSFFFRLGRMIQFADISTLSAAAVRTTQHVNALVFREQLTLPVDSAPTTDKDGHHWRRFASLLAKESVLPIESLAKSSMFMRIEAPRLHNRSLAPSIVNTSGLEGDVYGFQIPVGESCEFTVSHYVPALERLNTTIREIGFALNAGAGALELDRQELTMIGNAGTLAVRLGALKQTAIAHELVLKPVSPQFRSQPPEHAIQAERFRPMQLSVVFSWPKWFRRTVVPNVVHMIALFVIALLAAFTLFFEKVVAGTATVESLVAYWPLFVLCALASALATWAAGMLSNDKSK